MDSFYSLLSSVAEELTLPLEQLRSLAMISSVDLTMASVCGLLLQIPIARQLEMILRIQHLHHSMLRPKLLPSHSVALPERTFLREVNLVSQESPPLAGAYPSLGTVLVLFRDTRALEILDSR